MTTDSQLLKDQLLRPDHGFRQLAEQHHILDTRLDQLSSQHILSEPEQLERITLKKRESATFGSCPLKTTTALPSDAPGSPHSSLRTEAKQKHA